MYICQKKRLLFVKEIEQYFTMKISSQIKEKASLLPSCRSLLPPFLLCFTTPTASLMSIPCFILAHSSIWRKAAKKKNGRFDVSAVLTSRVRRSCTANNKRGSWWVQCNSRLEGGRAPTEEGTACYTAEGHSGWVVLERRWALKKKKRNDNSKIKKKKKWRPSYTISSRAGEVLKLIVVKINKTRCRWHMAIFRFPQSAMY